MGKYLAAHMESHASRKRPDSKVVRAKAGCWNKTRRKESAEMGDLIVTLKSRQC